mmetsp:Transcript_35090/g.67046  ORF Transcript_35090/g.67046 Transcript_35090/m.67046 type:complete len:86 (+) Transcript_35090:684-941(+)
MFIRSSTTVLELVLVESTPDSMIQWSDIATHHASIASYVMLDTVNVSVLVRYNNCTQPERALESSTTHVFIIILPQHVHVAIMMS